MSERDSKLGNGIQAWRQMSNHNAMIEFQDTKADAADPRAEGAVEIAFVGAPHFVSPRRSV